jgi:AraC-like DNA-binding protein
MEYLTHKPAPPLDTLVENLWWLGDAPEHARERIIPSGTFELVVNLDEDEIRVYDPDGGIRRHAGAVVSGTYRKGFVVDTREHASLVGVHFKPGGARAFIGDRADALVDAHVEVGALWSPAAADRLRDELCGARTPAERFAILERTLRGRLIPSLAEPRLVQALLSSPHASIARIAAQLGCSHRRFIERFSAEVGMTPKLFLRVQRLQCALALASGAIRPSWAQLARRCGYFDQSHLIRDFVDLAGVSPVEYARRRSHPVKPDHIALF